jgi:hypothetical protein
MVDQLEQMMVGMLGYWKVVKRVSQWAVNLVGVTGVMWVVSMDGDLDD